MSTEQSSGVWAGGDKDGGLAGTRPALARRNRFRLKVLDVARSRADLVSRLEEQSSELVEAIYRDVRESEAAYGPLTELQAGGIQQDIAIAIAMCLELLRADRRLSAEERQVAVGLGAERSALGVRLDRVLASLHIARRRALSAVVEVALSGPVSATEMAAVGQVQLVVDAFVEDLSSAMTKGYLDHQIRVRAEQRCDRTEFVDAVLCARFDSEAGALDAGRALGIDFDAPHGLVLFGPTRSGQLASLGRARMALITDLCEAQGSIQTQPVPHVALLVAAPGDAAWAETLEHLRFAALRYSVVGLAMEPVTGPLALHQTYESAVQMIGLTGMVTGGAGLVRADELTLHRFLDLPGAPERSALVERTLGPVLALAKKQRDLLLDTVAAFFRHRDRVSRAAEALGVHSATVRHRLARVEELTGLSTDKETDRFQLELALRLLAFPR